jgi:hypothetical protein
MRALQARGTKATANGGLLGPSGGYLSFPGSLEKNNDRGLVVEWPRDAAAKTNSRLLDERLKQS